MSASAMHVEESERKEDEERVRIRFTCIEIDSYVSVWVFRRPIFYKAHKAE